MEKESGTHPLITAIASIGFIVLIGYFTIASRSIDHVSFAYAYADLAPIFIGVYGVFLAFLSAGMVFPPKDVSPLSRLASWAIAVLQVWAMVNTFDAFVRLKAALNLPVVDTFEVTTQTTSIWWAFHVAIMSFLFGITMYTVGGFERFIAPLFPSTRRYQTRDSERRTPTKEAQAKH